MWEYGAGRITRLILCLARFISRISLASRWGDVTYYGIDIKPNVIDSHLRRAFESEVCIVSRID